MSGPSNTDWSQQPQFSTPIDKNSVLGRVLKYAWVGNSLSGRDCISGAVAPLPTGVSLRGYGRNQAINGVGNTATAIAAPAITTYPFFMIAYGYFNTSADSWILSAFGSSSPGYYVTLGIDTATTAGMDIRYNFGTPRTLTLPVSGINTGIPVCMIVQVFSETDYRFYCNGKQVNGTLSPGTLNGAAGLNRISGPVSKVNGGSWFIGYGNGSVMGDAQALAITADPTEIWRSFHKHSDPYFLTIPATVSAINLTSGSDSQSATSSTGSVSQVYTTLVGSSSTQDAVSGTGSISGDITLVTSDCTQVNTSNTGSISQIHITLVSSDCSQASTSSTGSITSNQNILTSSSDQTATSSIGNISQVHILFSSTVSTSASSDAVSILQTHVIAADTATQIASSSNEAVVQSHTLSVQDSNQVASSGTGAIGGSGTLAVSDCIETATSSTGVVTQIHILTAQDSSQSGTSSTGSIGSAITLVVADCSEESTSTAGSITQTQLLVATGDTQAASTSTVDITQTQVLTIDSSIQSSLSVSGSISQILELSTLNTSQDSSSGSGSILQAYNLLVSDSTQNSSNIDVVIGQVINLAALNCTQINMATVANLNLGDYVVGRYITSESKYIFVTAVNTDVYVSYASNRA